MNRHTTVKRLSGNEDIPLPEQMFWGIEEKGSERWLTVGADFPMYTLNSSIWGGGYGYRTRIMNRQVPKSYRADDPAAEMAEFLQGIQADPGLTAGMLTSANISDLGCATMQMPGKNESPLQVTAWVTAGLSNKARAGLELPEEALYPGTINMIIVVDAVLSEAAMVNAVITATEAKAAVLQDMDIRLRESGLNATGTSTDAIVIAATQRGESYMYAGTATRLGHMIGRTVYDAAFYSTSRYLAYMAKHFPEKL
ncbi:adenosylcobinamide amidohydrolase [Paenibacillus sp. MBLB4367]|uniref:adenosylcobinamide amidohydrolase n=1 Tax=Paenibacillus sp. MBLB4367 TaxID=3384767 RepID=UPI00390841DA